MSSYDHEVDRAAIHAAAADLIAEAERLTAAANAARVEALEAARAAAVFQPGDRVTYTDRKTPAVWQVDGIKYAGYAGSFLYVGRPIRKDGQPADVQPRNLYPQNITGPAT